jgi:NADH dehydrogenase [ubiquinone] 1 alpha subcomplex assembly factor 5
MISAVDFGNLFARCEYNMPTIYSEKYNLLFNSAFHLMEFLQYTGESNALLSRRTGIQRDVLLATEAIYQELFKDKNKPDKVGATFQVVNFLGWKYHESQQKPKKRGSAEFSLKVLQKEIEDSIDPKENKITQSSGTIEVSDSDGEGEADNKQKK